MRSVAREASSLQRQLGSGYRSVKIVVKKAAGEAQKLLKVPQVKPSEIPGVKPEVPVSTGSQAVRSVEEIQRDVSAIQEKVAKAGGPQEFLKK